MFDKRKQREKMTQMVQNYTPTSKASLKQFCIMATNGDVDKADKLYNFYMKDMEDLPMFDPVKPTAMQNVKATVTDIFSFVKENQDGIMQGVEFVRGLIGKGGKAVEAATEALPPIN